MKVVGVIPARMGSRRFPGKPLATICGRTMLEHVYQRTALSTVLDEIYVATCDDAIREAAESFGAAVVMTSDEHTRCTDRVAEAMRTIDGDVVVNVQGDEPLLHPETVDEVAAPLLGDDGVVCTTIVEKIDNERDFESENVVKVVCSLTGDILYFSREPIPTRRTGVDTPWFKQAGILAFTREFLVTFDSLPETPLERVESVDLMRALEHGYPVRGVLSTHPNLGVDTPEDLERAEQTMAGDALWARYRATP